MSAGQMFGSILVGSVIASVAFVFLSRKAGDWLDDRINRMVIDGLAAMAEEDAKWDREIDQAIALTETPLFKWLASENPGAIDSLAAAEASRADWSQVERWSS